MKILPSQAKLKGFYSDEFLRGFEVMQESLSRGWHDEITNTISILLRDVENIDGNIADPIIALLEHYQYYTKDIDESIISEMESQAKDFVIQYQSSGQLIKEMAGIDKAEHMRETRTEKNTDRDSEIMVIYHDKIKRWSPNQIADYIANNWDDLSVAPYKPIKNRAIQDIFKKHSK